MSIGDIGKLAAAIGAGTIVAYVASINSLIPLDVHTRLSCGQTIQEVNRDHYKQSPLFYYLEWPGRSITGNLTEPNPQKDESCFKNEEYNENTHVRFPRLF